MYCHVQLMLSLLRPNVQGLEHDFNTCIVVPGHRRCSIVAFHSSTRLQDSDFLLCACKISAS